MITDVHTHHTKKNDAIINVRHIFPFKPETERFYSIGIHPWDIENCDTQKAFKIISVVAENNPNIIAVGECGIDAFIDTSEHDQTVIFEKHIKLSEQLEKPLIIHCVLRSNDVIRLHRKYKPRQPWVVHGFRSNTNVLRAFLAETNIYLSVGEKFNTEAVKILPAERLLIETDESLLNIEDIAARVANARSVTPEEILATVTENTKKLFG